MDKNAIKKYAVWARNELIARVTQKAEQYEITEKKITPKDADSINGRLLTDAEKNQRKALIEKIQADGFEQVMEEVAYTWFNRFTALRFMEVNNYLPSHTRVFTNEAGEFKPQILADAIQLDLEGLDMDKVFELKDANKTEELYKYLLITQCNALSRARNELSNFCDYCLMKMFVTGDNPVIKRHKKKRNRTVAKKKASKIDTLSELQEDKMYVILSKRINGASCAVALMASGFHPREIEGLTWEDVIIYGRDYVVVKLYKSDYASATHNYSRPVVPQAAEILFKYKQMLVESYGKKADTFPIAGMSRDPAKKMDSNRIVREAKDILVGNFLNNDEYVLLSEADAEMAAATKVLHNTYRRDLELRCQLINDQGRLKFLLGESLANDVTADAYTAFTSPEGERANYGILKCLRRKEMVTGKEACTSETVTSKSIVPAYTTEFARGYAAIRLKPGERIHIYSEYGHELRILSKKEGE